MEIKFGDCWSPANAMVREIMEMLFPNYEKCGDFAKFLEALETLSKTKKKPVRIVCFMNDRLYNHIKRRKGWHTPIFAKDALEYIG